ncbi:MULTISPECIES: hypothetical protein [Calothrix]|uniref:Uncharacterized protein n=2 Tax=Calothrix TaxID=1186 RepID=A0ABR8AJ27_9CYAN|nr:MULTISPECIES: hypothetical protein [Calothrix]MBD2199749.1 hypothetical protein [Calothrix parietina FACHB-288]MBD2228546.1 hypothetical protein [Calothrix anomala FACHB-343]
MFKYHYAIAVNLYPLDDELAERLYGKTYSTVLYLDTNNRLVNDEILSIRTPRGSLSWLKITKIVRYQFYMTDDNRLVEMDMTQKSHQENRPFNTTDEVWFDCKADALQYWDE